MDTCRDEDLPTAGCLAANAVDSSGDWSDQARFPDQWAAWSSQIPQDKLKTYLRYRPLEILFLRQRTLKSLSPRRLRETLAQHRPELNLLNKVRQLPTSTDEDDVYSAYATGDTTNNYTSTSSDDDLVDSTVPADTSKSTMSTIAWGSASTQTVTRTQGEGGASETIAFTLVTGVSLVTLGSGSADMQSTAVLRILRPPVLVAASAVWLILGLVLVHAGV
ncbi:hypothetical protein EMMF5_005676 [Cystobasidiomycetes sp. EMM_F5]